MGGNPLVLHVQRVSPLLPDAWAVWFADDFKGGKRRDQRGFMSIILAADSRLHPGRFHHGVDMQRDASLRRRRKGE